MDVNQTLQLSFALYTNIELYYTPETNNTSMKIINIFFYFALKKKNKTKHLIPFTGIWSPEGEPDLMAVGDGKFRFRHVKFEGPFTSLKMTRIKKLDSKSSDEDMEK